VHVFGFVEKFENLVEMLEVFVELLRYTARHCFLYCCWGQAYCQHFEFTTIFLIEIFVNRDCHSRKTRLNFESRFLRNNQ